jgi:hypothetical protein
MDMKKNSVIIPLLIAFAVCLSPCDGAANVPFPTSLSVLKESSPTVRAGNDVSISQPDSAILLIGGGSDAGGTGTRIAMPQESGPNKTEHCPLERSGFTTKRHRSQRTSSDFQHFYGLSEPADWHTRFLVQCARTYL